MDSRSGFGVLIVLIGLAGMWALVTGKFQLLIDAATKSAAPATSTTNSNSTTVSGTPAPAKIGFATPLAPPSLAYGVVLGGDGASIEPLPVQNVGG